MNKPSYQILLTVFLISIGLPVYAAPKAVTCPTIVDLELKQYSNSNRKYRCYKNANDAKASKYKPLAGSVVKQLNQCIGYLNQSTSFINQQTADLSSLFDSFTTCKEQLAALNCPNPTSTAAGVILPNQYSLLEGGLIYASDGTQLGVFSMNRFSTNSISNSYGTYGSSYSATSIFNSYGVHGSAYSSSSAFNKYAANPPIVYLNGTPYAYITINKSKSPRVNSEILKGVILSDEQL